MRRPARSLLDDRAAPRRRRPHQSQSADWDLTRQLGRANTRPRRGHRADVVGTALVLANGDTQVAILDIEFCIVTRELARPIREAVTALTGIPFDNVRLSDTHTHSGPSLGPTWLHEGDEMVPEYVNSLPHRLAGAAATGAASRTASSS